jgi:hypothetical protein
MMILRKKTAYIAGIAFAAIGMIQAVNADYTESNSLPADYERQDMVVTLKSDPTADLEKACLTVTMARMLSMSHNVTLFVTLDGVSLAADLKQAHKLQCNVPASEDPNKNMDIDGVLDGKMTLAANLEAFLGGIPPYDENPDMVNCPLCWMERYPGEMPKYGVMPGVNGVPETAIGQLLSNAEEVIDF